MPLGKLGLSGKTRKERLEIIGDRRPRNPKVLARWITWETLRSPTLGRQREIDIREMRTSQEAVLILPILSSGERSGALIATVTYSSDAAKPLPVPKH